MTCSICGRTLPVDDFFWRDAAHTVRRKDCRKCQYSRHKKWRNNRLLEMRAKSK